MYSGEWMPGLVVCVYSGGVSGVISVWLIRLDEQHVSDLASSSEVCVCFQLEHDKDVSV